MECEQSEAGSFIMDRSVEVEDFRPPSRPKPYQFEPLAQGADSAKPEARAATPVEEKFQLLTRHGCVFECDGFIPKHKASPHKAHHVALSAEVQIVPLGWYRTGGGRLQPPIHLPQEPGDGSIGCPLFGSEHSHEDGLVGPLTKGGKACR
ncbi:hypothetical protein CRENBAI_008968 [Crenichthys baileyi]|uniref:Uncharacterized protein n=1 Tax=Crenichthys baileyi TaxID=28760 RepID=A0AAV9RG60_9TELE